MHFDPQGLGFFDFHGGGNLVESNGAARAALPLAYITVTADPQLGPLQVNGPLNVPTHALPQTSPAIDKGSSPATVFDQRGAPRISDDPAIANFPGGNGVDIGAYERRVISINNNLPNTEVGANYSTQLTANPSGATYTFSLAVGSALPPGLTLSSGGLLSGVPTQNGAFNFSVTAATGGDSGTTPLTLPVACQTISVSGVVSGTAGEPYSDNFRAFPSGAYNFAVTAGNLPPGLTLNAATGALTGTPAEAGNFIVTVQVTGLAGCTGSRQLGISISCPTLIISPSRLSNGQTGAVYSQSFSATPVFGAYTFAATDNSGQLSNAMLPPGLTLSSAGILSGVPTTPGAYQFGVRVANFGTCSRTVFYSLNITEAPPVAGRLNTLSLPGANPPALVQYVTFAQAPDVPVFPSLTVEAWVRLGSATGRYDILNRHPLFFNIQDGKPALYLAGLNNPGYHFADTPIPVGVWTHVAATWDGALIRFYLNGASSGTRTVTGGLALSTYPLSLGFCIVCGPGVGFLGELDEIRLWRVARAQPDITGSQYLGLKGNETGLEAYWRFDEPGGTTVYDATGHGFNGTLNAQVARVNGDNFSTDEDTPYSGRLFAYTFGGASLSYSVVAPGGKGTVTITDAAAGTFTYAPQANANGPDSFTYKVNNGTADSNIATVNVTLNPVNDPPTITPAAAITRVQGSTGAAATIATAGDTETLAGSLTIAAALPAGITLANITNTNGTITAHIQANCNATPGAQNILLAVTDAEGASATANFTVNVTATTPPVMAAQTGLTRSANAVASTSPSAVVSDAESAAGNLTVTVTSANPANGVTLANLVNTNGVVTASIATAGATTASFTLQVSDGCATASAMLTVTISNECNAIVTNGNWGAPATWGCGGVPGAGQSVLLQRPQQVTLNTNPAALASLTITRGATLTLDATRTLAADLVLNNGGTLALNGFDLNTGGFTLTLTGPNCPAGSGDIVGNVRRNGLIANTTYCFSHADNTIAFDTATFNTPVLTVNLSKGGGVPGTAARLYTITPGGISDFSARLRLRYSDSELNGLNESTLRLYRYNGAAWEDKGGTPDAANNHVSASGITAFSPWTIGGPSAPTAVTLLDFAAVAQARGGVVLNWRTGYEADCLGFNVYREADGQRLKLTPALVAGSALLAAGRTTLSAGNGYRWTDARGAAGAGYWLEEVDLNGARHWFGPVYAKESFAPLSSETAASPLLHELNATAATPPREWLTEDVADEPSLLQTAFARVAEPPPWTLPNQDAVKLGVNQTGWYRVTAAELQAAGFNPNVNPLLLQLYTDGVEVPLRAYGKGATLEAIEFYGQALDTPATATRVYWLIFGVGPGARWRVDAYAAPPTPKTNSFRATVERREKLIYFSGLLNGDAENWFGPVITNAATTQTLTARFIDRAATATLELALQGVTEQAHAVNVELNGQYLGTANFSGKQLQRAQFQFASARLLEGANEVRCLSTAGASDISLLDTLRLHYTRGFVAERDTLRFRLEAGQSAWIGGFSTANLRLLELDANGTPARELTVKAQAAASGFGFGLHSAAGAAYLALGDSGLARVAELKLNTRSNWRAKTHAADFVIVTPRAFLVAANRLAQARRSQELRTVVVEVEDVYDEFSFGHKSPQAIKDLLTTARAAWQVKPRFALFIGDATTDPRNYLGLGDFDFIPTKLGAIYYFETALDNWFADANDDGAPELALGRLPVRNAAQADALLTKLLAFKPDPQPRPALLVSDRTTDGVNYQQQSQQYAALLPALMFKQFVNRQDGAPEQVRAQIINTINRNNPLLVNWAGHGSTQVWTGDGLLRAQDAPALTNRAPGLFVMATCLNGYFIDPRQTGLGEALLLDAPGGALAVAASSALNFPAPQHAFNLSLYRSLFSGGLTLGEAMTAARLAAQDRDVQNSYVLFGDPTLKLR